MSQRRSWGQKEGRIQDLDCFREGTQKGGALSTTWRSYSSLTGQLQSVELNAQTLVDATGSGSSLVVIKRRVRSDSVMAA